MKVIYYLCCLFFFSMYTTTAQACLTYSWSTDLIEYTTKTKPTVKPKSQDLSSLSLTTLSDKSVKLASIYFISSDSQLKGKKITSTALTKRVKCPQGTILYAGQCEKQCDLSKYPLTTYDIAIGHVVISVCKGIKHYGYDSCYVGWDLSSARCNVHSCSSSLYPYTSNPGTTAGELRKGDTSLTANQPYCKSGSSYYYGYSRCYNGWYQSGSKCIENACDGYSYTTSSITGCQSMSSCQKGASTRYKCTNCYNGWYLNGSGCTENACDGYTSTTSSISNCATTASCQKGASTRYKCTQCNDGYGLSGGSCVSTCNYTNTSKPSNCASADNCTKNGKRYYSGTCSSCNSGYTLSGGQCVSTCTYTNTSKPSNCTSVDSCTRNGTPYYSGTCRACDSGYILSGGQCIISCTYTKTAKPSHCTSTDSCVRNGTPYYAGYCKTCDDGYDLSDGQCWKRCNVGDIYYAGGICSPDKLEGYTAIGVIFDTSNHLAVSIKEQVKDNNSGNSSYEDAIKYCSSKGERLATSTKELQPVYKNRDIINAAIEKVSGMKYVGGWWWTTEEVSNGVAYIYHPADDERGPCETDTGRHHARCIFSYGQAEVVDTSVTDSVTPSADNSGTTDKNDYLMALLEDFRKIAYFPEGGKIEGKLKKQYEKVRSQNLRKKENFPVVYEYYRTKEDENLALDVTDSWLFAMTLSEIFPEKRDELYQRGYGVGVDKTTYGRSFKSDLNISRLIASVIYAQTHDFDEVKGMRTEAGTSIGKSGSTPDKYYIALDTIIPPPPLSDSTDDKMDKEINEYIIKKYLFTSTNSTDFNRTVQATADDDGDIKHLFGDAHEVTINGKKVTVYPVFGQHNIGMKIDPNSALAKTVVGFANECSWSRDPARLGWQRTRPGQGSAANQKVLANYDIDNADGHLTHGCTDKASYETCVKGKPYNNSYPSGHSAYIWCSAMVLSEVIPDKTEKLMEIANEYAINRTVSRYHWTSDTINGRVAGSAFLPVAYAIDYSNTYVECLKKLKNNKNATCSL